MIKIQAFARPGSAQFAKSDDPEAKLVYVTTTPFDNGNQIVSGILNAGGSVVVTLVKP